MAKPTAGKWRAMRVLLRKHSQTDAREKTRVCLTCIAVLLLAGWIFFGFLSSDRGAARYSPGPLSTNHERFSCNACHDDFSPMQDQVMTAAWEGWHRTTGERWDRGSDKKCLACHPLAAMPGMPGKHIDEVIAEFQHDQIEKPLPIFAHSANELTSSVESCASCHLEHQGRDAKLNSVSDASCVRCHQDLKSHVIQASKFKNSITNYAVDHPDFRSLESNPGTMQDFNHRLHLWPGLSPPAAAGASRKQYQPSDFGDAGGSLSAYTDHQTGLVQLRCEFCHKQAGDTASVTSSHSSLSQFGGKSEFMTMPNYEQSCKVCHPLEIQPGSDRLIEHGLSPEATRSRLIEFLTVKSVKKVVESADPSTNLDPEQELLARRIWEAIKKNDDASPVRELRDDVLKAENHLRLRCAKCHQWSDLNEVQTIQGAVGPVRTINNHGGVYLHSWLQYGRFDHYEHRDLDCARCHAAAYADKYEAQTGQRASEKNSELLIANHKTCTQCHQPAKNVQSGNRAAAYNCTFCHSYHGGGNRTHQILNLTTE